MKKTIFISSIIIFTSTLARAISLCGDAPVDECAKVFENTYVEKYAEIHQKKESPLSRDEFVNSLKEAVGSEQFKSLYQKCTESAQNTSAAVSCINSGFTPLLTRKVDNKEAQLFIQNTLPSIVKDWSVDTFQQHAVSFFPTTVYPEISQAAIKLFGGCQVDNIEEKGRKFEMTYGFVMHDYVAKLTCEKIKNAEAGIMVVYEKGAWKYSRIDLRKSVNINF